MKPFDLRLPFAAILLAGCGQSPPAMDLEATEELVARGTGLAAELDPTAAFPTEAEVAAILADGLSLEEALDLTLRNDPELRAGLYEVGIGQAELLQAGLLTNPRLDLAVRFPGDGTGTLIDALLGLELLDAWRVPLREEVAERRLRETVATVARAVVDDLHETRMAYLALQYRSRDFDLAKARLELAEAGFAGQLALLETGLGDQAGLDAAQLEILAANSAQDLAEAAEVEAKGRLALALALPGSVEDLRASDPLPHSGKVGRGLDELLDLARDQRLDLAALEAKVEALEANRRLQGTGRTGDLSAGPSFEDPGSGDTSIGPGLSWTIPLFDRNQAGIAKAEFALEQARLQLAAAEVRLEREVRAAWQAHEAAWARWRLLDEEALPLAEAMAARVGEAVRLGSASRAEEIAAQVAVVEMRRQWALASWRLEEARLDLARTAGIPLQP